MDVPIRLLTGLLYDRTACRQALKLLQTQAPLNLAAWRMAAQSGLSAPPLREVAADSLQLALSGMRRLPNGYLPSTRGRTASADFGARFVEPAAVRRMDQLDSSTAPRRGSQHGLRQSFATELEELSAGERKSCSPPLTMSA